MYWSITISQTGHLTNIQVSDTPDTLENTPAAIQTDATLRRPAQPREIMESLSLTELPRYMDDDTLQRFLEAIPVSQYIDLDNTILQAAQSNQATLLRCLLGHLNPNDCPATFDHYGYKTLEAQRMGFSTIQALEYTLEKGTPEILDTLFTHDTVIRTFLNSRHAYQIVANVNNPEIARHLQRAVCFEPADTTTQKQRLSCLKMRMMDTKPDERLARDSLRLEVRAIAANLSIKPKTPEQVEVLVKLALYGIALGMEQETRHDPVAFVDDRICLTDLIEGPLRIARNKELPIGRSANEVREAGKQLYVAGYLDTKKPPTMRQELYSAGETATYHNAIRIPHLDDTMNQVLIGKLALTFADNQALINLVAEKLYEVTDPTARQIASQLANTAPRKIPQIYDLMSRTQKKEQPLPTLDFDDQHSDTERKARQLRSFSAG